MRELAEVAATVREISPDTIMDALMAREREFSTAIELGIAVPHARLPGLDRPVIVFGRSDAGIEWNAPDGKLSRLIFMVLTPAEETQIQLQTIGILARALATEEVRRQLLAADIPAGAWHALQEILATGHIEKTTEAPA
jgi:PTS system fructose-specific IIA component